MSSSSMSTCSLPRVFFISLITVTICVAHFTPAWCRCSEDERTLLLELKKSLIFDSSISSKLVHWNQTGDCCIFGGVECDGVGRVIGLQLDNEGISGGLEDSSSLFGFRNLKKLNLGRNQFNGSQIPTRIGSLTSLTHLNLGYAGFGGQVPFELSFLTRLVSLDVRSIGDQSVLPYNLGIFLRNLTGLRQLYLDGTDISGHRSEWYHIISSSLPHLRNLSLSYCHLQNPPDPYLSRFRSLTVLRLSGNNLSTIVPTFFANLSSLIDLRLRNCSLKGLLDLPFRGLSNLVYLYLSHNSLSGSIPHSLFRLPSLEVLELSNNQFSGRLDVPTLNFSSMYQLELHNNRLEGPIPESLFQRENLQVLYLSHNFFNGTFQLKKIARFEDLAKFDISYNNLSVDAGNTSSGFSTHLQLYSLGLASCNLYHFPYLIKNSKYLERLDLSGNMITGEIPGWIWDIGALYYLNLSSNLFVDLEKPYKISNSLEILDLHSNQLRGELTLPILPNSSLYYLSLANNNLSGSIPTSLCNAIHLAVLDLSLNKLTGNIPPCLLENMEKLVVFKLTRNNINGHIPNKFSINCLIKTLDLSDNNLQGNIPVSLANCTSLVVMNVRSNNINDSFPCMLPPTLGVLVLRSNKFYGELRCYKSWPNLQIIDIAYNNFSGNLYPEIFSSWGGMMFASDARLRHNRSGSNFLSPSRSYQDEVTLTIKGVELKLVKIWPDFTSIDFSSNNFNEAMPDAIGDLTALYLLNLSHNALTGTIPKSLGKLRQLGSLDLSMNQLTGLIPVELGRLTSISVMNLSYNKLVGEIPNGRQMQTFSPTFFQGNTGLCGLPLNIRCNYTDQSDPSPLKPEMVQSHGKKEIEWEYVSAALGYVVGLGGIAWILLCCQSLRTRYFEKVDEILEKIFSCHDWRRRHEVYVRDQDS